MSNTQNTGERRIDTETVSDGLFIALFLAVIGFIAYMIFTNFSLDPPVHRPGAVPVFLFGVTVYVTIWLNPIYSLTPDDEPTSAVILTVFITGVLVSLMITSLYVLITSVIHGAFEPINWGRLIYEVFV